MALRLIVLLPLVLAVAAPAPAQSAAPPWSELEPSIREADWIVLAELREARAVGQLGLQLRYDFVEALAGQACPASFLCLGDAGRFVGAGDRDLLLLRSPEPGGFHLRVAGRVGARDPAQAAKIAWLKKVLELRRQPLVAQGRAFVGWYEASLRGGLCWEFWRALGELERLRRERPPELRALLRPALLEEVANALAPGAARQRIEALLAWARTEGPG